MSLLDIIRRNRSVAMPSAAPVVDDPDDDPSTWPLEWNEQWQERVAIMVEDGRVEVREAERRAAAEVAEQMRRHLLANHAETVGRKNP